MKGSKGVIQCNLLILEILTQEIGNYFLQILIKKIMINKLNKMRLLNLNLYQKHLLFQFRILK